MVVAVIPARGGSKRLPGKNIRKFCGKPVISYSIQAAFESGVFDRVLVSTDCKEIAEVAAECGADVPFLRPAHLSDEFATTVPVIQHAIEMVEKNASCIDYVCCLYATAPFVSSADITAGFEAIQSHADVDFALPVTTFPYSVHRALKMDKTGGCSMLFPGNEAVRSQDLPEAWHDAGQFYWGHRNSWLAAGDALLSSKVVGLPVPRSRVQDIDTLEDWRDAELKFQMLQHANE